MELKFSHGSYNNALGRGDCAPPMLVRTFFPVDRVRFHASRNLATGLQLGQVKKRLSPDMFRDLRGALGLTMKHAQTLFPAYRFLAPEYVNEEWLASVDWHKKFHRDHVLHQPMCVHVGFTLLNKLTGFGQSGGSLLNNCTEAFLTGSKCRYLREHLKAMGARGMLRRLRQCSGLVEDYFLDVFFLSALFHDLGYPWQFTGKINDSLGALAPVGSAPTLDPDQVLSHYGQRLFLTPLRGYLEDPSPPASWAKEYKEILAKGLSDTHGLPGAVSFLHLNDLLRVYPNQAKPLHRFGLEWAAMAIMMHDMGKMYAKADGSTLKILNPQLRLCFDRDPLSFVLALTDLIQDFARPDASFMPGKGRGSKTKTTVCYGHRCQGVRIKWDEKDRILEIIYQYKRHQDYVANKTQFLPEGETLNFDPSRGYLDPGSLGIKRIHMNAEHIH